MQQSDQTRAPGAVNHPNAQEWMSYLYGELPRQARAPLAAHLKICAECRQSVREWQSAMGKLNSWQWQAPTRDAQTWLIVQRPLRWALAALVVLALGCLIGRWSAPRADITALRAAVEKDLTAEVSRQIQQRIAADWQAALSEESSTLPTEFQRQLRAGLANWSARNQGESRLENQRLVTELGEHYSSDRQEDRQMTLAILDRMERKRQAEYVSLRRAVETVALVADDKFQRTETELGTLASYAQVKLLSDRSDQPLNP